MPKKQFIRPVSYAVCNTVASMGQARLVSAETRVRYNALKAVKSVSKFKVPSKQNCNTHHSPARQMPLAVFCTGESKS